MEEHENNKIEVKKERDGDNLVSSCMGEFLTAVLCCKSWLSEDLWLEPQGGIDFLSPMKEEPAKAIRMA